MLVLAQREQPAFHAALDHRPVIVAVAGPMALPTYLPNHAHLQPAALRLVNAHVIVRELAVDPNAAAALTASIRHELVRQRESFVFETVFSHPVSDKLSFLEETARAGYAVVLCFIGISGPDVSEERVVMRVSQGGHDLPTEKLVARYPRVFANLRNAMEHFHCRCKQERLYPRGFSVKKSHTSRSLAVHSKSENASSVLPQAWIFDNDDLRRSFRLAAICEAGRLVEFHPPISAWLKPVLPGTR